MRCKIIIRGNTGIEYSIHVTTPLSIDKYQDDILGKIATARSGGDFFHLTSAGSNIAIDPFRIESVMIVNLASCHEEENVGK